MENKKPKEPKDKKKKTPVLDFTRNIFGEGSEGFNPEPQINPTVEIFSKVVDEIYSIENLELKTELNDAQIMAFSKAREFADYYKVPLLADLVKSISKYSISRSRKGRKEFESIAKANLQISGQEEREKRSIPQRLFGG